MGNGLSTVCVALETFAIPQRRFGTVVQDECLTQATP